MDFLEGLAEVLQRVQPEFERQNMYAQGIDANIVEQKFENAQNYQREQDEQKKQKTIMQKMIDNAGSLTQQKVMEITIQNPQLGQIAAGLYKQNQEATQQAQMQQFIQSGATPEQMAQYAVNTNNAPLMEYAKMQMGTDKLVTDNNGNKVFLNSKTNAQRPAFENQPQPLNTDFTPDAKWELEGNEIPVNDLTLQLNGSNLGQAAKSTAGILPQLQRAAGSILKPSAQFANDTLGTNIKPSETIVGSKDLEGATREKQLFTESFVQNVMNKDKGRTGVAERERIRKLASLDQYTTEDQASAIKNLYDHTTQIEQTLIKEIEATQNIADKNKLISKDLIPLQQTKLQLQGALSSFNAPPQTDAPQQQPSPAKRLKYNLKTGEFE